MTEDPLKHYPVWSNFVYFFAGVYSLVVSYLIQPKQRAISNINSAAFFCFGVLIIGAGISSIVYHLRTPSWTGDLGSKNEENYKISAKCDMAFAISAIIYACIFLIVRLAVYYCDTPFNGIINIPLFNDSNWWISVFFIVMAIIFFGIAHAHDSNTEKCKETNCVDANMDGYDVFHSNWHIFAAVGAFFWINVLTNSYSWK